MNMRMNMNMRWRRERVGSNKKNTKVYKLAFENGELINPNRPMSRSEAIAALKEQKDLLDLGMITIEQFDIKKAELGKFIK